MKIKKSNGRFFRNLKKAASKNSSAILIGFGIAGFFGSMVLVGKEVPKATEKIEKKKKELKKEKLTPIETVQTVWSCYAPSAALSIASMWMILKGHKIDARKNAVLAAAYGMSETAFKEYRDKTIETIGEKKEREIHEAIAKDKAEKHPASQQNIIYTGRGNHLCFDTLSAKYFYSDIHYVKSTVLDLGIRMLSEMYISENDYYAAMGLPLVKNGDERGWNNDNNIGDDLDCNQSGLTDTGEPYLIVDFYKGPKYEYKELH